MRVVRGGGGMSESSGRRELRSSLQFEGGGSYIGIHGNMRGWRCASCLFVRFNQCLVCFPSSFSMLVPMFS